METAQRHNGDKQMIASLKIQKYLGSDDKFTAYVKIEGICDWTQVFLTQADYYVRATGQISIFYSPDEARAAARKFAQAKINNAA